MKKIILPFLMGIGIMASGGKRESYSDDELKKSIQTDLDVLTRIDMPFEDFRVQKTVNVFYKTFPFLQKSTNPYVKAFVENGKKIGNGDKVALDKIRDLFNSGIKVIENGVDIYNLTNLNDFTGFFRSTIGIFYVQALNREIVDLQESLKKSIINIVDLRKQKQIDDDTIQKLEAIIQGQKPKIQQQKELIEEFTSRFADLENQIKLFNDLEHVREIKSLGTQNQELRQKLLREEAHRLSTNQRISKLLQHTRQLKQEASKEIEKLKGERKDADARLAELETDNKELQKEIADLRNQLAQLQPGKASSGKGKRHDKSSVSFEDATKLRADLALALKMQSELKAEVRVCHQEYRALQARNDGLVLEINRLHRVTSEQRDTHDAEKSHLEIEISQLIEELIPDDQSDAPTYTFGNSKSSSGT